MRPVMREGVKKPERSLTCHRSDKASQGAVKWRGSWRSTLLAMPDDSGSEGVVDCSNVFSDVLHRPFACRNIVLSRYAAHIPMANRIHRFEDLSHVEFARKWTTQPFILTNCIQEWPVYREWTIEALLGRHSDANFRAEAVDWPLSTYCDYMNSNQDESPLYLFDRKFAEKMGLRVGQAPDAAYWRPECFGPDLFEVLGHERPAHRWLIIGPERSGSTFHKDPNATSAWNAVIRGSKYWIMFPPHVQVPGVYVSSDSSEVTSPLSIAEWLLAFHEEARQVPGCVEALCKTGEILHVPSGWWHLVVNMEQGIALTQNFVPQSPGQRQLSEALLFLRDKPDQVSGFQPEVEDPYGLFVAGLEAHHPGLLAEAMQVVDRKGGRKRRWDAAVGARDEGVAEADAEDGGRGGFTFGFGAVDAGEIP